MSYDLYKIRKKVGNIYQIAGTRHYELLNGSCKGTRAIDVKTGGGLEYTVVPDRGLDISLASYKGTNLVYQTPNGEVNPAFYNASGNEWLRTFFGGLLTTCGPNYLGPPCKDGNEKLGLHGRYSTIPAKDYFDKISYDDNSIRIEGNIEECSPFGPKIVIHRTIISRIFENKIRIVDEVENIGSKEIPLTMLYHQNFGYPLLSKDSKVFINSENVEPYDDYSLEFIEDWHSLGEPNGSNQEKNYFHTMKKYKQAHAAIVNTKLGLCVYTSFDTSSLPFLTQWKLEDEVDYVLALEPCNTRCESRTVLRNKNMLPHIGAHEKKKFELEIGVLEGVAIQTYIDKHF